MILTANPETLFRRWAESFKTGVTCDVSFLIFRNDFLFDTSPNN